MNQNFILKSVYTLQNLVRFLNKPSKKVQLEVYSTVHACAYRVDCGGLWVTAMRCRFCSCVIACFVQCVPHFVRQDYPYTYPSIIFSYLFFSSIFQGWLTQTPVPRSQLCLLQTLPPPLQPPQGIRILLLLLLKRGGRPEPAWGRLGRLVICA